MRNLTLIKCTPGHPMSMGHTYAFGAADVVFGAADVVAGVAGSAHLPVIAERKRFGGELTTARVQVQTTDLPSIVSAPPPERRP